MTRQRAMAAALLGLALALPASAQRRSDVEVSVHGTILANGFRNSAPTNNGDVPTFALAPSAAGRPDVGGSIRQTRLRIEARHPEILGGRLFAELDADFYGGQQPSGGGRTHPLLRVRRALVELRWSRAELLVGQEAPPLFGVSPASLAAVGFPLFASSGNLWLWLPQIRATGWLANGPVRVGVEGTVLAPNASEAQDPFLTRPDRAEASGRPSLEARVVSRWRVAGREGEASVGAHRGWLSPTADRRVASWAIGAAAIAPLSSWLELRGEVFDGAALAGLGGGGIGQSLRADGGTVSSTGGWLQAVVHPVAAVELALGAGRDDPRDADLAGSAVRTRNQVWAAQVAWRPAPLLAALEVRRLRTDFGTVSRVTGEATHLNLALGVEF